MDGRYGHENDRGMGSIGAALIGAAVGAVAMAWAHKDTREKIKQKAREMADEGKEKMDEFREKGAEKMADLKEKIDTKKNRARKEFDEIETNSIK